MKSILIIGMGDFGHHLCRHLSSMHNEVLVMDKSEQAMEDLDEYTTNRLIADCTSKNALARVGVSNFDICFVCIGSDFQSNLIIVTLLKELGAKYVISQTDDEMLERLLLSNGADEIIYPNKDSAIRAAMKYSDDHIYDYIPLKSGYAVFEISPLKSWVGKSILTSNIRVKYDTYIIEITTDNGTAVMPNPNTIIKATDRLTILTHEKNIEELLKKM